MTKEKYIHWAGISFLLIGVVLRIFIHGSIVPLIMIMIGGSLKLSYIAYTIIIKTYRPGKELLLLLVGLLVFFCGIYLKRHAYEMAWLIIGAGLLMKITFLILFSRKKNRDALIVKQSQNQP